MLAFLKFYATMSVWVTFGFPVRSVSVLGFLSGKRRGRRRIVGFADREGYSGLLLSDKPQVMGSNPIPLFALCKGCGGSGVERRHE